MKYKIYNDDVIEWSKTYNKTKFHAMLCDPPYHLQSIVKRFGNAKLSDDTKTSEKVRNRSDGYSRLIFTGFMGQKWDGGDIAFNPETWALLGEHLYPGAFGMAFSASRNWHRLATAIEDAGFILHPTIFLWAQGQGFPKATRIDKKTNDERWSGHRYGLQALKPACEPIVVFSKSKGLWYTEIEKDLETITSYLGELWNNLAVNQEEIGKAAQTVNTTLLRKLNEHDQTCKVDGSNVEIVERSYIKHQESLSGTVENEEDIVQENATISTEDFYLQESANNVVKSLELETLYEKENIVVGNVRMPPENSPCWRTPFEMGIGINTLVGMLQSNLVREKLDLSMIWLWSIIWADVYEEANKSTIEMNEKMITALKILNYSLHRLMQTSTQSEKSLIKEQWLYAQDVTRNFIGLLTCLKILEPIVSNAVSPIIVFQKPYEGKPLDNITQTGAGALNIDGTRIPLLTEDDEYVINTFDDGAKPFGDGAGHEYTSRKIKKEDLNGGAYRGKQHERNPSSYLLGNTGKSYEEPLGRWPANFILTEETAQQLDSAVGTLKSGLMVAGTHKQSTNHGVYGQYSPMKTDKDTYADSGGPSRFFYTVSTKLDETDPVFYCAKASPTEKTAGLDERSNHPTHKPLDLCRWLATLLLPPDHYENRTILVPFSGVGSELIGAGLAGWDRAVGIENDTENGYVDIAHKRLKYWLNNENS